MYVYYTTRYGAVCSSSRVHRSPYHSYLPSIHERRNSRYTLFYFTRYKRAYTTKSSNRVVLVWWKDRPRHIHTEDELYICTNKMASKEAADKVVLHPLAIVSMSSMFTRTIQNCSVEKKKSPNCVIGCLLGTIQGMQTDIHDVFEFPYSMEASSGGAPFINVTVNDEEDEEPVFQTCKKLALEVHQKAKWEVVGWFAFGNFSEKSDQELQKQDENDIVLHKQMKGLLDASRLIYLRLSADADDDIEELPVEALEVCAGSFTRLDVEFHADKAEDVAMGHIEKMKAVDDGLPPSVGRLKEIKGALAKLQDRIESIKGFLAEAQKKQATGEPVDAVLLREIAAVVNQLPALSSTGLDDAFVRDYNNAQLVTYLAVATKMASTMGMVLEKSKLVSSRKGGPIRFRTERTCAGGGASTKEGGAARE